jgi:hypothetical protein
MTLLASSGEKLPPAGAARNSFNELVTRPCGEARAQKRAPCSSFPRLFVLRPARRGRVSRPRQIDSGDGSA